MAFSFEIAKPRDIKETLAATKQKIIKGGGRFSGDEKSGRFSGKGVDGIYSEGDSSIKITITRKPVLYPESAVKSAIADFYSRRGIDPLPFVGKIIDCDSCAVHSDE